MYFILQKGDYKQMALSPVDRNVSIMKENWGTTRLITDYTPEPRKKVIQEVMYDPELNEKTIQDIYEDSAETNFGYGIEPTYKIQKNQRVLQD